MIKRYSILILFCVAFISICRYESEHIVKPDIGQKFRIYQSYIQSSGGSDTTEIFVIICDASAEIDDLFYDVENFHNHMNGTPNSLTIHLYKNKKEFEAGNESAYKIIHYKEP